MTKGETKRRLEPNRSLRLKRYRKLPLIYPRGLMTGGGLLFEGAYNRNTKSASKQAIYSWRELISQGA